jgi:hypothetical protein
LPIGGGSRVLLVFTVHDPAWAAAMYEGGAVRPMPQIQRTACR